MSMSLFSVSVIKLVILQCSRCTSSLSETNRATNGHRFVFQSSEVLGTERHYIPNEKGILPFVTTGILNSVQPHTYPTPQLDIYHTDNRGYRADSYGQTPPIDSLSTAPALEFTNILDYSQSFGHDSWTVSCTTLFFKSHHSNALLSPQSYSTVATVYILLHSHLASSTPFLLSL